MTDSTHWISVGELAHAFAPGSNTPRSTDELAGRTLTFDLENGQTIEHKFDSDALLTWVVKQGSGQGREAQETYRATKVREHIYFVDFVRHLEQATTKLVVDLEQDIVTVLLARLPGEAQTRRCLLDRAGAGDELTAVSGFLSGAIDTPFTAGTPRHLPTSELVGKRVEYTYSSSERYEHVYLNGTFYTWHCLQGSEEGLADTDRCHYLKVASDLYFFVWRERSCPYTRGGRGRPRRHAHRGQDIRLRGRRLLQDSQLPGRRSRPGAERDPARWRR